MKINLSYDILRDRIEVLPGNNSRKCWIFFGGKKKKSYGNLIRRFT